MHPSIAKGLYTLGARVRNPSLGVELARLQESEFLPLTQLIEIQNERLARLVRLAAERSPYYARVFSTAGLIPEDIRSSADLKLLPAISKATLISQNREIHTNIDTPKAFIAETSGTTGVALEFTRSERWDSVNRAHQIRAYSWYGVKPWDRNGYLWGYNIDPAKARRVRLLDQLQNRFRLFKYDKQSIREFALALRGATFLGGYSSMVFEVAKALAEQGVRVPGLRLVKGTSETILDVYHTASEEAFGRRITSEYGAAEAGLIAFECPSGGLHVNVEDVVLETTSDGDLLVTNLASETFPIIRYSLGDSVRLSSAECSCGRKHPLLAEVSGRRGGTVYGKTNRYPALTFYYVFKNLAIGSGLLLNYRARQAERGACQLLIEHAPSKDIADAISQEFFKYFGDDVDLELTFVDSFATTARKVQYFEGITTPSAPEDRREAAQAHV